MKTIWQKSDSHKKVILFKRMYLPVYVLIFVQFQMGTSQLRHFTMSFHTRTIIERTEWMPL